MIVASPGRDLSSQTAVVIRKGSDVAIPFTAASS